MNASSGTIACPRGSEIVALRALTIDPAEWDALAACASEPNAFAERWFVAASIAYLDPPADARMLVIREAGRLIGLMPVATAPRYGRIGVRHTQNWLHVNAFLGTPLVRCGAEAKFWSGVLALLDGDRHVPGFLHVTMLDGSGPLAASLLAARKGTAVVHQAERALLASSLTPEAYYEATVRKKKRKEIARLQARLKELGEVVTLRFAAGEPVEPWIDDFLALEASGWKGSSGAALANDTATIDFTRTALRGAADAGRLQILRMDVGGRPIAMLINFLTPPGSFSWKIAFDEDHARFSPGVLIQVENLALLSDPAIDWMDSCAAPDHPMINSLWGERRTVVRVTVPLRGWQRRLTFSVCRSLERTSAWLRSVK